MYLCTYKDLLGKPGQGFHRQRIFGFALFDIIGTAIAAYLISIYSNSRHFNSRSFNYNFIKSFLILFLLGTFLHIIFCVDTAFLKLLKTI